MYRPHHLQTDHGGAVLAQDNIVDVIVFLILIHKKSAQPFSRDVDRRDQRLVAADILHHKSEGLKIYILLGG